MIKWFNAYFNVISVFPGLPHWGSCHHPRLDTIDFAGLSDNFGTPDEILFPGVKPSKEVMDAMPGPADTVVFLLIAVFPTHNSTDEQI
jgi:hypothetical protein